MKKLNILVLLFVAIIANAQTISGTVKSREDQGAVPFAKIGVENEKAGTIADGNGQFSLDLTGVARDKTVKVEVGGYDALRIPVSDFIKQNPQNILLSEKVREIAEVKINPKTFVSKNWGINSKSKHILYAIDTKFRPETANREIAIEINTGKRAKIQKINMNIAEFVAQEPVPALFNIYSEKNGLPDKILNESTIVLNIDSTAINNGAVSIEVSDQDIWVKGKFFVAVQFLNKEEDKVYTSAKLFSPGFTRYYFSGWEKISMGAPAINIDVKVEK